MVELRGNEATTVHEGLQSPKAIGWLDDDSIDLILRDARSHYAWTDKPVSDEMLHTLFEITIQGPTSMNTCPARFVFVTETTLKMAGTPSCDWVQG